ncbi:MAG: Hsp20/alpha crystallin family protein, partial [Chloroflexota bacterium]
EVQNSRSYAPSVDIYQTDDSIVALIDVPGVDETSIEISLEKNVLTVTGSVEAYQPENYRLAYGEYKAGDYARRFTLPNDIDADNITATAKQGVLTLDIPKAEPAKTRRIEIKAAQH